MVLEDHLRGCVSEALRGDGGEAAIKETIQVLRKTLRPWSIRRIVRCRSSRPVGYEIVAGHGGRQILLEDPSGSTLELFRPA